ncbi:hypothetical protein D9M68_808870 [compost metagenome]
MRLAGTGRPLDGEQPAFDSRGDPERGIKGRFTVMLNRLAANAGLHTHQEIACSLKGSAALYSVIGDILADANERVREDFCIDYCVGKKCFRMDLCAVRPFFYVDPAFVQRNCIDPAELRAAEIVQVFAPTHLRFLGREAVAMDRCFCGAPVHAHKCKTRKSRALVE